jgi:endonuclease YncB( thermonuclease family)
VTQAKRRYEEDRKEEEAARKARLGEWVWKEEAGYYYNAVHRWYYDTKTSERGSLCG